MTGRREDFDLQKVTLNLYSGEFGELRRYYPGSGAGKIVRTLVHAHLIKTRSRISAKHAKPNLDVDLKEILP